MLGTELQAQIGTGYHLYNVEVEANCVRSAALVSCSSGHTPQVQHSHSCLFSGFARIMGRAARQLAGHIVESLFRFFAAESPSRIEAKRSRPPSRLLRKAYPPRAALLAPSCSAYRGTGLRTAIRVRRHSLAATPCARAGGSCDSQNRIYPLAGLTARPVTANPRPPRG